jgi:membrane-bound ClpP family serine protease
MKRRKIFSLILSLLEQLALVAAVLWILPKVGISIPVWGLILMMLALGAYSILGYRLGEKVMKKSPMVWPAAGSRGRATTPVSPSGYVLISNERWKALSTGADIARGTVVTIVRVEGTQLWVTTGNDLNEENNGRLNSP